MTFIVAKYDFKRGIRDLPTEKKEMISYVLSTVLRHAMALGAERRCVTALALIERTC